MPDRICVAQIGAAHGVRGEVRLWPFTAEPLGVANYGVLETEDGLQRFEIEDLRQAKDHLVARISGVGDRDAAEQLTNLRLYVPRDRLPETDDPDTFYHADLIGLMAIDPQGGELGQLVALHNFGAGDIVEIRPKAGGPTVMLPFTDRFVPQIDIDAGRITVDLPDGAAATEPPPETRQGRGGSAQR